VTTPRQMLASAVWYSSHGWRVFPCHPRAKAPLGAAVPHGCLDATTEGDLVRYWWTRWPVANIGLATGQGLLVIDIDGPGGEDALLDMQLTSGLPDLPETLMARTGRGRHLLFSVPPDIRVANLKKLLTEVDLRGDGAYIIAPPSVHPSGATYTWIIGPRTCPLAPLPPEWRAMLPRTRSAPTSLPEPPAPVGQPPGATWVQDRLDEAAKWLWDAGNGERHWARFGAGQRAGRLAAGGYVGEGWAIDYLMPVACRNSSWPPDKVRRDLASSARYGRGRPWTGWGGDPGPQDEDLR